MPRPTPHTYHNLIAALKEFVEKRGYQLNDDPLADLVIPIKDGSTSTSLILRFPTLLLTAKEATKS